MTKQFLTLGLSLLMMIWASVGYAQNEQNTINVLTTRSYGVDKDLFSRFEKESGIVVNVVEGKLEELVDKIKSGEDADLLFITDGGLLSKAKSAGVFQPVDSAIIMENIPGELRDKDNMWTALSRRARVIVYSKDRVKTQDLSTYADLADSRWKGKVAARPQALYDQSLLAALIFLTDDEGKSTEWVKGVVANFARPPKGNDRQQVKDIAAGVADVALVNTYYLGQMRYSKDAEERDAVAKIGVLFPDQKGNGTHVNIIGAGLAAQAKNKKEATKLLEFLTSPEAQETMSKATYFYPANPKAKKHEMLDEFGPFKAQNIDFKILYDNHKKAKDIMTGNGWD